LVYGNPGDIDGSIHVGVDLIATRDTEEAILCLAIGFLAMPTSTTDTAGVAWVYQTDRHTLSPCLVADEQSQLVEGPTRALPALAASNRDSLSNPFQVFKHECLTLLFGLAHEPFADFVVDEALKACLFSSKLAQTPAGAAGVGLLQSLAVLKATLAYLSEMRATVVFTVRIGRQVHQTEIDAKQAGRFIWRGSDFGLRDVQIPDACASNQFRTADLPGRIVQGAALEVAKDQLPARPSCQRVQAHPIQAEEAIGASIITNAAVITERRAVGALVLSGAVYRFCRLVSRAARQLCAKSKGDASCAIDKVMQFVFVGDTLLPRDASAIGCSTIEGLLRLAQRDISRIINLQLAAYGTCGECLYHRTRISQLEQMCNL
jgi:hypothetical protein